MQIQLTWIDPNTNVRQQPYLYTPIAIGRDFAKMPSTLRENRVSRIVINHPEIEDFHAIIALKKRQLVILSRGSTENIAVNSLWCAESRLEVGDKIFVPPVEIEVTSITREQSLQSPNLMKKAKSSPVVETSGCNKVVGLLFPRRCGRKNSENCPHCQGGKLDYDPYFFNSEQSLYPHYGEYRPGSWGAEYYEGTVTTMDFTDADAVSFESQGTDFEQDMGAS